MGMVVAAGIRGEHVVRHVVAYEHGHGYSDIRSEGSQSIIIWEIIQAAQFFFATALVHVVSGA